MARDEASRWVDLAAGLRESDVRAVIRVLDTQDELDACVRAQRATWGEDYRDIVPAAILQVARKVGGVAAGAFLDDALVGFVFGLTGIRHGHPVHWSHMLAVHPDLRDHGIGRRLKEFQRDQVLSLGVEMMNWTFDPLVSRNAHLNLTKLGVQVEEYVPDMYGDTGSALHRFGTDRFIVSWRLKTPARHRTPPSEGLEALPIVERGVVPAAARVRVEIPHDVESMFALEPEEARAWRERTRLDFLACVSRGYGVEGFHREPETDRCFYVMAADRTDEELA